VNRVAVLAGKWLGLSLFACGYLLIAGMLQFAVVRWTVGYWPPHPITALALLGAEAVTLLTLSLLLSSLISPLASGVVSVGLFGAAWVAGVVGGVGAALDNDNVRRVGTVAQVVMPTDGLWRGAMHAIQDPTVYSLFPEMAKGFPFLSPALPSLGYLSWVLVWLILVAALCALSFTRRDV
jgi:ABC-type transport system involved in multi-copper enzyme maturation permease subunit